MPSQVGLDQAGVAQSSVHQLPDEVHDQAVGPRPCLWCLRRAALPAQEPLRLDAHQLRSAGVAGGEAGGQALMSTGRQALPWAGACPLGTKLKTRFDWTAQQARR